MDITHHVQTEESLRRQNEYLSALHDTALGLLGRLEIGDLLQALVSRAALLVGAPSGFIYLGEPGAAELTRRVVVGLAPDAIEECIPLGEGLVGRVWATGEPLVVDDYDTWPGRSPAISPGSFRALVGVPLKSNHHVAGVIGLAYEYSSPRTFSEQEAQLLGRFAQLASIALDNAQLFAIAREARSAAEAANQAKSTFLANVSHELRTPLTSIVGFTRMVQKRLEERIFPLLPSPDASAQKAMDQVMQNLDITLAEGHRLTSLINDLLDLSKIEAGREEWNMQPVSLQRVFYRAAAATASLFVAKKLRMNVDVALDLPEVMGDFERLVQVAINLLSNTVKFTNQGMVSCRVWRAGDDIRLSIADTGVGISETDLAHVFEAFVQVGDAKSGKPRGTGLGLAISKQIVEKHGGRIWAESVPGQGSTFTFALPVRNVAEVDTAGKSDLGSDI